MLEYFCEKVKISLQFIVLLKLQLRDFKGNIRTCQLLL